MYGKADGATNRPVRGAGYVAFVIVLLAVAGIGVEQAAAQTAAPAVGSVSLFSTAPGGTYQLGDTITVRVDFDLSVATSGFPQVSVTIGSHTRKASFSPFAGTRASAASLFFKYTVQSTDSDTDGISIPANAINLNGGSITAVGDDIVDAVLTHSAVAASTSHKVDGSRSDTPKVSSVSFVGTPASGDIYQLGEEIEVKVVFDRFIKTSGSPKVAITIGSATRLADLAYGRGPGRPHRPVLRLRGAGRGPGRRRHQHRRQLHPPLGRQHQVRRRRHHRRLADPLRGG